ncbi:hypothetical protein IFM89_035529 [Coptis chinensis]|uniref:Mitochondrial import inner membrane translocase subunit TIM23 n=1 Tax=Coptis chinensis TaxID=261450 RepID=A0A835H8X9_9MAGN|nr:hypothetical protein IFM89_035529 [Coptis chinensis]
MENTYDQNDNSHNQYHQQQKQTYYDNITKILPGNLRSSSEKFDILFEEERLKNNRSLTEDITYYAGTGYLTGAILGGLKGTIEGLKSAELGDAKKIRINRALNAGGLRGRKFANVLGCLGLIYAGMENGVGAYRGSDDLVTSVIAGLGTGAIYRMASGLRGAAVAGAIGAVLVGAGLSGKQVLKRYVRI